MSIFISVEHNCKIYIFFLLLIAKRKFVHINYLPLLPMNNPQGPLHHSLSWERLGGVVHAVVDPGPAVLQRNMGTRQYENIVGYWSCCF